MTLSNLEGRAHMRIEILASLITLIRNRVNENNFSHFSLTGQLVVTNKRGREGHDSSTFESLSHTSQMQFAVRSGIRDEMKIPC